MITAALVFGPSKIAITSILGANYGYSLLWVVIIAILFMVVFTNMSARIGIASDKTLLKIIEEKWGKTTGILIGIGIFFVTSSFQAGNSIGVGVSIGEPTGTPPFLWIVIFNVFIIALLFFRNFYKVLEKVMIGLIILMLSSFVITLFLVKPNLDNIADGLVPKVPSNSIALIIAFVASAFSIVGACYQSYLVQEQKKLSPTIRQTGGESNIGIYILGLMSAILLITSATVLFQSGLEIHSVSDMAQAIEPLFGKYASYIFMAGFFGASFSSLLGNATLGGSLFGDALGYGGTLNSNKVRLLIGLIIAMGAMVSIIFGKLPIQLIVFAQAVTIFIVPFIGFVLFSIANDKEIMGKYKNKLFDKVVGLIGLIVLLFLAFNNIYVLFIK